MEVSGAVAALARAPLKGWSSVARRGAGSRQRSPVRHGTRSAKDKSSVRRRGGRGPCVVCFIRKKCDEEHSSNGGANERSMENVGEWGSRGHCPEAHCRDYRH